MSENYIVINGKKADLTPEQLKALGIEVKTEKKNPFDTLPHGKEYCFIADGGYIDYATEYGDASDELRFNCANYCTDDDILQQQAYRETLNRLLWRFSMENGGACIDWKDPCQNKYYISFEHTLNIFRVYTRKSEQRIGVVYFNNITAAEQAIEEVVKPFMTAHPDFKL